MLRAHVLFFRLFRVYFMRHNHSDYSMLRAWKRRSLYRRLYQPKSGAIHAKWRIWKKEFLVIHFWFREYRTLKLHTTLVKVNIVALYNSGKCFQYRIYQYHFRFLLFLLNKYEIILKFLFSFQCHHCASCSCIFIKIFKFIMPTVQVNISRKLDLVHWLLNCSITFHDQ